MQPGNVQSEYDPAAAQYAYMNIYDTAGKGEYMYIHVGEGERVRMGPKMI